MRNVTAASQMHDRTPLPERTSLHRRYLPMEALRADGGTLVYAGFDYVARQPVSIVEFYPDGIATRAEGAAVLSPADKASGEIFFLGMEAFYRQYNKLLSTIGSANVLSIFDVFFENGTAYAIAEQSDGLTLADYRSLTRRRLSDGELVHIVRALSDALLVVHSCNLLHHGITEDTILLCPDGTVKLIDFAAGLATVTGGRAVRDDAPWRDIRALGETLYRAYTGTEQAIIPMYMDETVPRAFTALFAGMLSDSASQRFSSVFDLRYTVESLDIPPVCPDVSAASVEAYGRRNAIQDAQASGPSETRPAETERIASPLPRESEKRNTKLAAIIGGVLLLLLGILLWVLLRW